MKKLLITGMLVALLPLAACTTINDPGSGFSNTMGRSELNTFKCGKLYFVIDENARPKSDTTATGIDCESKTQYSEGMSGEIGTLIASLATTFFGWIPLPW